MKIGEIILIPFPFAELNNKKVRPAIVICETKDFYKDLSFARSVRLLRMILLIMNCS